MTVSLHEGRGGAEWTVALGVSLGVAVSNGFGRFAYGLMLPAMRDDLGWNYAEAGWINTANAIGYLLGAVLALRVISRVPAPRLFAVGLIVTTLALLASGLTQDFWLLTALRVIAGLAGAPAFIAGGVMASSLFAADDSRNALAIALSFGGGGVGMIVSGGALPALLEARGSGAWPEAWLLLGVMGAALSVAAIRATRRIAADPPEPLTPAQARLPLRAMAPALFGYFLFAAGYIIYLTFLAAWLREAGAGAALIGGTWAAIGLAVIVSPFAWRAILARWAGGQPLALACAASGFGALIPLFWSDAAGVLVSACVFGLSFFIAPTAITSFSRKNLPRRRWGAAVALFTIVFAIGQTLGPVTAGLVADLAGDLSVGMACAGAAMLLAATAAALQPALDRAA